MDGWVLVGIVTLTETGCATPPAAPSDKVKLMLREATGDVSVFWNSMTLSKAATAVGVASLPKLTTRSLAPVPPA